MDRQSLPPQLKALLEALRGELESIALSTNKIRDTLARHADGKALKGDEIVGWMGEVIAKLLLGGTLVHDDQEHDVAAGEMRVSVMTRKGSNKGWTRTGAIPRVDEHDCPTHLMFVHLDDDYSLQAVWLFPWGDIRAAGRFKVHKVRGRHRNFFFQVSPGSDHQYLIYSADQA